MHRLNSRNSFIGHPSMHAPSLARVFDGESGRVSGMFRREGDGGRVKGEGHCTVGCFVARCNSFCSCMLFSQNSRASRVL